MALLIWNEDLETGIDVIDEQHKRIVELINRLTLVAKGKIEGNVGEVLAELVDYTLSHFVFEEELMEEAGYPFSKAHKRVHDIFTARVSEYQMRFNAGEDVTDALRDMLSRWLFNHIKGDDKAYARTVRRHLERNTSWHAKPRKPWYARLFGG
ncbi:bacteriohemerythrin [Pseudofulvimonas gallinarii]|uniref:Bacteriohemerythrin n=1 Tax=Pseudofulvimonas gallinarii TaxID=634155 RepID=A0A4S3KWR9_9GAMM|nr:bacteriohemerythrin [Pseudofulvimonas gallinarii]TCS98452.1 hemerythrin [Pseudofulvimonas gallinarii]THD13747.1 bacteriohemerythrin [Pseudofulvimonas gallinarii]